MQLVTLLKPVLIYHSENPRALKDYSKSPLSVLYKWNNKAWMTTHLFATWFAEYFKPIVQTYCSGKKDSFQNITAHWQCTWSPKSSDGDVQDCYCFHAANTTSILQPMDQGLILTFRSCYLRNTFHKAIAATDSESSDGSGQSTLKTFWKGFIILDAIMNIPDSWEEVKISTLTRI